MTSPNWPDLIADLQRIGWTQVRIAERAKTSQNTISDLRRGAAKSTSYEIGQALVRLHRSNAGRIRRARQLDQVPPDAAGTPAHTAA